MSEFNLDLREFQAAIREVMTSSRKTESEILNRAGLVAIIGGKGVRGAIHRMPRADRGKINSLTVKQLAGAVIKQAKAKGKWPMTRQEFRKAITAERGRRRRAIGYTAGPGWSNAAIAFGGRGVKGKQAGFAQSKASKGYGDKATPQNLMAELVNTAPAADLIGRQALQEALNDTARDMVRHARERLQRTFDRNSA